MDFILPVLAIFPAAALMIFIYRKDRIEHEPLSLLAALCLGGCVAIVPAMICEIAAESLLLSAFGDSLLYLFMENFFGVALVEEGWKLVFLVLIAWKNPYFNHLFDGIVYAVFVSLGFALVENILYVTSEETIEAGIALAGSRALLSVPLHAFCGVFMGFFFSQAKEAFLLGNKLAFNSARMLTLMVPVAIHGFYDFCLSWENDLIMLVFFAFAIVIYLYAFRRVSAASKGDRAFSSRTGAGFPNAPQHRETHSILDSPQGKASAMPAAWVPTGGNMSWRCPHCGSHNKQRYCASCGTARPIDREES